jgi:hypothetical protein
MNQELLHIATAFFKERQGTYEVFCTRMLTNGIKQEDIDTVYAEIKRLGLDNVDASTNEQSTQVETKASKRNNYIRTFPPHIADLNLTKGSSIQKPEIDPVRPTVETISTETVATESSPLTVVLSILLVMIASVVGTFVYVTYYPHSSLATILTPTLNRIGIREIQIQALPTIAPTSQAALTMTQATSSTPTEYINGVAVPLAPDVATDNATLPGVDTNNNGVRDSIERSIAQNLKDSSNYALAISYAKAYQGVGTSPTPKSRTEALSVLSKAFCVTAYLPQSGSIMNDIDDLDIETMTESGNTSREKVYNAFYDVLEAFSPDELRPLCANN